MKEIDESARIEFIIDYLTQYPGQVIAVMVDTGVGHEDKGDRYIKAIRKKLPSVKLIQRTPGPVRNCETLGFKL